MGLFAQSPHGDAMKINCADCHNAKGWKLIEGTYAFNHNKTDLPLVGQHQSVSCKACHTSLVFTKTESNCVSCHTDVHQQTVGNDCARCHTPQSWIVENTTMIHEQSRFPLLGSHATADCFQCHESASLLRFDPLGIDCYDCHQLDYQQAQSPDHANGGFSTDCIACHTLNAFEWKGAGFNHLFFPLTLGHAVNDCFACHVQGQDYASLKGSACVSCHLNDFNTAASLNHLTAGFATTCEDCHTTNLGWKPATMPNHDNYFVLNGAHKTIANECTQCHVGNYADAPTQCYGCHADNYNHTVNPPHATSQFSTDCLGCHTENAWKPATYDHDGQYFPIYSGKHQGEWTKCTDCHTNANDYKVFSCIDCHEHSQANSADDHNDVSNYSWNSNACFECHPRGQADD